MSLPASIRGLPAPFLIVWGGQALSILGAGLSQFGLAVWVYQRNGSALEFALIPLSGALPLLLTAPWAGVLVDRLDRRKVMIWADVGGLSAAAFLTVLAAAGALASWHIYVATAFTAVMGALRGPAWMAAVPELVDREDLGRANGMVQGGMALSQVLAPVGGALLMSVGGVLAVVIANLVSFVAAVSSLMAVRFPGNAAAHDAMDTALWDELVGGWRFVAARSGMLALLAYVSFANLLLGAVEVLLTPMVLSFADMHALAMVASMAAFGAVASSVAMVVWGGPRRQMGAILGASMVQGICCLVGGVRPSVPLILLAATCYLACYPIINACSSTIMQTQVPRSLHGRVFALVSATSLIGLPASYALAGTLAETVFDPLLVDGGALVAVAGPIFGVGPGRGTGLLFSLLGVLTMSITIAAVAYRPLRAIEAHEAP